MLKPTHYSYKIWLSATATIISWASAYVGIRIGLTSYSPGGLALLRFLAASIAMLIIYWRLPNKQTPRLSEVLTMAGLGIVGFAFYNLLLNEGELTVPAGIAGFTIALIPVFMSLLARFFLRETIPWLVWIGIIISLTGVFLITIGESKGLHFNKGVFYTVLAAGTMAIYSIFQKPLLKKYHAIELASFAIWGATLFLLIYLSSLLHEITNASHESTIAAIYLGIFPAAIGFLCWSYVLNYLPTTKAGSLIYTVPLISVLMGTLVLHEIPAVSSLLGGLIALLGAVVINKSKQIDVTAKQMLLDNHVAVEKHSSK